MNAYRKVSIGTSNLGTAAATILLVLGATACTNLFGPDTHRYIIAVNDISAPDTIASTEALTVRFSGWIGSDLCSRLDRVERRRAAGLLEVRFHGERKEGGMCPQAVPALDHVELVPQPVQNPFTIRVLQPDGSVLEKIVQVR